MWGALSDGMWGMYFSVFAGHRQRSLTQVCPTGLVSIFYFLVFDIPLY
jgi:hypothetical protein